MIIVLRRILRLLAQSKDTYLSSLGSADATAKDNNGNTIGTAPLKLSDNSSFYCDGLCFNPSKDYNYSKDESSYIDATIGSNINSSIQTIMRYW